MKTLLVICMDHIIKRSNNYKYLLKFLKKQEIPEELKENLKQHFIMEKYMLPKLFRNNFFEKHVKFIRNFPKYNEVMFSRLMGVNNIKVYNSQEGSTLLIICNPQFLKLIEIYSDGQCELVFRDFHNSNDINRIFLEPNYNRRKRKGYFVMLRVVEESIYIFFHARIPFIYDKKKYQWEEFLEAATFMKIDLYENSIKVHIIEKDPIFNWEISDVFEENELEMLKKNYCVPKFKLNI